eukprot:4715577-Pleurochrysis_carterae.AAC.1
MRRRGLVATGTYVVRRMKMIAGGAGRDERRELLANGVELVGRGFTVFSRTHARCDGSRDRH